MIKPILLVEDSEDDSEILLHALKKAEIDNPVFTVRSGEKAIAYLRGDDEFADRESFPLPCVVLLDLNLPKINGFEILKWITTQPALSALFVVVLSGYNEIGHVGRAYALGARSFLVKPLQDQDILNLVRTYPTFWVSSNGQKTRGPI
jgi:CheY-like chemotaxis protein